MIFLIEYHRETGSLVGLKRFAESERNEAAEARLRLEIEQGRSSKSREIEIVLLEAADDEALKLTHRRYFENLKTLVQSSTTSFQRE